MRGRMPLTGVLALALFFLFGRIIIAQDQPKLPGPAEEVKVFKGLVGAWDTQVKFYMEPGKPPQESVGVMKRAMIMDGRFLEEKYEGKAFGSTSARGAIGKPTRPPSSRDSTGFSQARTTK